MSRTALDELLARDVWAVAEGLLGWTLESSIGDETTALTITETEAYAGTLDPASHAFRGPTNRNKAMYDTAGTAYVYRSYGIHWCLNVVAGVQGRPHAVLIRGGEPTVGQDVMEARRERSSNLADGPGKLCMALGVTDAFDGADLRKPPLRLIPGPGLGDRPILRTPRIGISKAVDLPWRFVAARQR